MKSFGDEFIKAATSRRYEPQPRKAAGRGVHYVAHRFPIKGGISLQEVMALNISRVNPMLQWLAGKK